VEEQRRRDHGNHPTDRPQILQLELHGAAQQKHQAVERRQQNRSRQRVGGAAPHEDLHVHQAVANNRVGEGQRDQDERKDRQTARGAGNAPGHEGRDVENHKRRDAPQSAIGQPTPLLAQQSVFVAPAAEVQEQSAGGEVRSQQPVRQAVEQAAELLRRQVAL
jgi:hypothetical protein